MTDIVERLRDQGKDAFAKQYSLGMYKLCDEAAAEIERLRAALAAIGGEAPLPTYGSLPWDQLGRDVMEANMGTRCDFEFDPKFYPGHQSLSTNFNSLARIVDKYRVAAQPASPLRGGICCYCDATLCCSACGMEQHDAHAQRAPIQSEAELVKTEIARAQEQDAAISASEAEFMDELRRRNAQGAPTITDEMVNAAAREMWNDRDARHGGAWDTRDPREVCVIQTKATARAALKAALTSTDGCPK